MRTRLITGAALEQENPPAGGRTAPSLRSQLRREERRDRISEPQCGVAVLIFRRIRTSAVGKVPFKILLQFPGEPATVKRHIQLVEGGNSRIQIKMRAEDFSEHESGLALNVIL
jgi:hypothetical protein